MGTDGEPFYEPLSDMKVNYFLNKNPKRTLTTVFNHKKSFSVVGSSLVSSSHEERPRQNPRKHDTVHDGPETTSLVPQWMFHNVPPFQLATFL